jgi:tetratricopeptide (TPR) repeat protein
MGRQGLTINNLSKISEIKDFFHAELTSDSFYFSNVSLFFRTPFQVARDICLQLSGAWEPHYDDIIGHSDLGKRDYNTNVEMWIDKEAYGKETVIKSFNIAAALQREWQKRGLIPAIVLVFSGKNELGADNECFLYALQKLYTGLTICLLTEKKTNIFHLDWSIGHELRKVNPELSLILFETANFGTDHAAIAELNTKFGIATDLHGNTIAHAGLYDSNPKKIIQLAWQASGKGNFYSASQLLEYGYAHAKTPDARLEYLVNLQIVRLTHGYFHDASMQEYPDSIRQTKYIKVLQYCKAYCGTMSGQIGVAKTYYEEMGFFPEMEAEDLEGFYRLNIYALFNHLVKKREVAESIEKRIETGLAQFPLKSVQLNYINSINLARIYKQAGRLELAELYYKKAYMSIRGCYIDYDNIYKHAALARLSEAKNEPEKALFLWILSAMFWSAKKCKEALSFRAIALILNHPIEPNFVVAEKDIEYKYIEIITRALGVLNRHAPPEKNDAVAVGLLSENLDMAADAGYVLLPGKFGAILKNVVSDTTKPASETKAADEKNIREGSALMRLINGVLDSFLQLSPDSGKKIWLMDDCHPDGAPLEWLAVSGQCYILGIRSVIDSKGHHYLTDEEKTDLEKRISVTSSSALSEVNISSGISFVRYKRYFADRILTGEEANVLGLLKKNRSIGEIQLKKGIDLRSLRTMAFEKRIVQFEIMD